MSIYSAIAKCKRASVEGLLRIRSWIVDALTRMKVAGRLLAPGARHLDRGRMALIVEGERSPTYLCKLGWCDEVKARVATAPKVITVSRDARLLAFAFYQRLQHGFEGDLSFSRAGVAVLELDPALIEAIQHPDAGCGILHALRLE